MASAAIPASASRLRGIDLQHDPTTNKSTAYTEAERQLGLVGLVPDVTESGELQSIVRDLNGESVVIQFDVEAALRHRQAR